MNASELRAQQLFKSYKLKDENDEVKRNLMILLLSSPKVEHGPKVFTERFAGKWQGNDSAEEIIESIREARTYNDDIEL